MASRRPTVLRCLRRFISFADQTNVAPRNNPEDNADDLLEEALKLGLGVCQVPDRRGLLWLLAGCAVAINRDLQSAAWPSSPSPSGWPTSSSTAPAPCSAAWAIAD